MRRYLALFAALAISITGLTTSPASASVADGTYQCSVSGSYSITSGVVSNGGGGAGNCTGHANIPNGVTAIGDAAFYQSGLATVSIPNTVTAIGDSAFRHMPNMTTVTIPTGVQSIGFLAFGTTLLTSINFTSPSSLTTIGDYAFQSSAFTSITIPASVTSIGTGAFQLNTDLTEISFLGTVPSGSPWEGPNTVTISPAYPCTTGSFAVANNVVTNGSSCTGTATIPSGVTAIGAGAFQNSGLTSVTLPAGVTEIRNYAFYYASSLSSINLPSSLTSIGVGAFINNTSLASITLPVNLSSLGNQAFLGSGVTSISIPNGITTIGDEVFSGAASLASVTLPNTLTSIGSEAFKNATSLSSITLPSSLMTIGTKAFQGDVQLTAINIPSSVTSIGTLAFHSTRLVSVAIPSSVTSIADDTFGQIPTLSSLTLPSTLTAIGAGAFYDSSALTSITIPAGVTSIGAYAFGPSSLLTAVNFLGNAPATVDSNAFYSLPGTAKAYIGSGATGFGSNGSTWKGLTVEESADGTYSCTTGLPSNSTPNFTLTSGVVTQGQACTGDVVIPSDATSIGANAFSNGTLITSIEIPNTVTSITSGSLLGLSALTAINVALNNANYSSTGGVLFNKLGTTLIKYPAGKTATSYTVNRFVTSISSGAFDGPSVLASINFASDAPSSIGQSAFSGLAVGARALIEPGATGFANIGITWNGLVVASTVSSQSSSGGSGQSNSSPSIPTTPKQPVSKVSGVQLGSGKTAKTSTVKLQLSGVKQDVKDEDIQIKIFDVKGNLFKVLTVPINGTAGSLEVSLPLALGEFTVEANTVSAAGAATESIAASSPIIQKTFFSTSVSKSPTLFGEAFARPITFGSNSSVLLAKEKKALMLVAVELRKTRSSLAITGFSAKAGASRSFEKSLANSRALSVARFLKAQGLSNILYISGFGATDSSKNSNSRKVELRLIR